MEDNALGANAIASLGSVIAQGANQTRAFDLCVCGASNSNVGEIMVAMVNCVVLMMILDQQKWIVEKTMVRAARVPLNFCQR